MSAPNPHKEINWYRTKLPKEVLAKLNERSDAKGWIQTGGFLAICMATAAATIYAFAIGNWWLFGCLLLLHGTVSSFQINAVHELVHLTVFKTKWLNDFFAHIFGFIGWNNNRYFWYSHTEHHKYTLHDPDDLEVLAPPAQYSFWGFLKYAIIHVGYHNGIKLQFRYAFGKFNTEWDQNVCPEGSERAKKVKNWSRMMIAGHLLILAFSAYTGNWAITLTLSFGPAFFPWLFQLCNNTQHVGLPAHVADFRINCRTFYLNPVIRFLYWHMNYHIEHHMYAAVPCYNLKKLHEAIQHELPHCPNGLVETWVEISAITYRQKADPEFRFVAELPDKDGNFNLNKSRLEQVRSQSTRKERTVALSDGPSKKWECSICGFIYDEAIGLPEEGIAPGTAWEDIPDDWRCPDCGVAKADFDMVELPTGAAVDDNKDRMLAFDPIVIIGSGMAGYSIAREFRKHNTKQAITLITRDNGDYYSKPMLSNALASNKTATDLATASAEEMAKQLNITVQNKTLVERIDRSAKKVITTSGEQSYSKLILALGADQIKLPLKGKAASEVISVNDLKEYDIFRSKLPANGKVLIIGAGLIGCEFANDLASNGYSVDIVDIAKGPLGRLLPEELGKAVKTKLSTEGINWHLDTSIETVDNGAETKFKCTLANATVIEADVVLSAVGLKSRTDLAKAAGLEINRGIVVDSQLQSSDENIYAIGDCAEVNGTVLPFIQPITVGSKSLVKNLAGEATPVKYPVMPVLVKTPSCPIIIAPPAPKAQGFWKVSGEAQHLVGRYESKEGKLLGFALTGDATEKSKSLAEEMENNLVTV